MGTVSRNRVSAKIIAFSVPWKNAGSGQPIMCPIEI